MVNRICRMWISLVEHIDFHAFYKQARNQLGTPGGAKSFPRAPCPIFLSCVQQIFPGRAKKFLGGLRTPWLRACL